MKSDRTQSDYGENNVSRHVLAVAVVDVDSGVFPPEMFCQLKLCQIGNKPIDWLLICLCLFAPRDDNLFTFLLLFRTILRFMKKFTRSLSLCSL